MAAQATHIDLINVQVRVIQAKLADLLAALRAECEMRQPSYGGATQTTAMTNATAAITAAIAVINSEISAL